MGRSTVGRRVIQSPAPLHRAGQIPAPRWKPVLRKINDASTGERSDRTLVHQERNWTCRNERAFEVDEIVVRALTVWRGLPAATTRWLGLINIVLVPPLPKDRAYLGACQVVLRPTVARKSWVFARVTDGRPLKVGPDER